MLVLTRTLGQVIRIGGGIEVTILAIKGHQVRVGISAPANVVVDREEIAEKRLAAAPRLRPPAR